MKVTEINKYSDFIALKDVWNKLLLSCDHSVFSTWEWLSVWWKHFNNGKKLKILLIEEGNEIIAIAPMMFNVHSNFGFKRGAIEFLGTPESDYCNFLITKEYKQCQKLLLSYLKESSENWASIDLTDVPSHASNIGDLTLDLSPHFLCNCYYISLPKTYDEFLKNLGHNTRYKLRKDMRRLSQNYKLDFVDCSTTQSIQYGISWLFNLHQKRWVQKGYEGAFADPKTCEFHQEIAHVFANKDWLVLSVLKLSDLEVAAIYGYKYNGKFYQYLNGVDPNPDYFKYGVGNQLTAYNISKCIDSGIFEVDFLRGDEQYKTRWTKQRRKNIELTYPKPFFGKPTIVMSNLLSDNNPALLKSKLLKVVKNRGITLTF
jgi:CelD/BcsL family acetyltransferase involved in cellulose biosynthesis